MPQFNLYPPAAPLTGTEIFLISQNNSPVDTTVQQIANFAAAQAQAPVVVLSGFLSSGFTATIPPSCTAYVVQGSSETLATGTLILPTGPTGVASIKIFFACNITAFILLANQTVAWKPLSAAQNSTLTYLYVPGTNTWYVDQNVAVLG